MKKLFIIGLLLTSFFLLGVYFFPKAKSKILNFIAPKKTIEISPLTLETIFDQIDQTSKIPENEKISIIVTGDVLLARSVNARNVVSNNFKWPFEKTADFLKDADLTFINLETPIIESCPITHTGMVFCSNPRNLEGLEFAGVDIVNIANNHIYNYGSEGRNRTYQLLNEKRFLVTGYNGPIYKEVNGTKFAFLGYDDVVFTENIEQEKLDKIKSEILDAKKNSDVVIVQFHWGIEYTTQISNRQKTLAHFAIDNGADLIIGNHPHWIQPLEIYKGKVIMYAHGNFVMDQEWSKKTKEGVLGKYTFYKNQLIDVAYSPVLIENYGQPRIIDEKEAHSIIEELKNESYKLMK